MRIMTAVLLASSMLFASMVHGAPIVIKFSHVVAEDTPKGKMANTFRDLVHEKLGDKVKVEVYPNSELATDEEVVDKILAGDVQMAAPTLSKLRKYTDKLELFDLPFLFTGIGAVDKFNQTDEGRALLKSMEDKGITGLGYLHNGMKQLSANSPLYLPADAAGLKFRIMPSDVLVAQFEALGAEAHKKPFKDVHGLLKSKKLDGQENTWSNIYSQKFHEVQRFVTESNHGYLGYMVLTNSTFWNGLDAGIRKELEKILTEAIGFGNQSAVYKAVHDKRAIVEAGKARVIELKQEEKAQWVEVMKPVWAKFEDQVGKDMIEAAFASN